jgi:hypothetical protein
MNEELRKEIEQLRREKTKALKLRYLDCLLRHQSRRTMPTCSGELLGGCRHCRKAA